MRVESHVGIRDGISVCHNGVSTSGHCDGGVVCQVCHEIFNNGHDSIKEPAFIIAQKGPREDDDITVIDSA